VGRRHGGQREGNLELLQSGGTSDAPARSRQHREHGFDGRYVRRAFHAALHYIKGSGDRSHARFGAELGREKIRVNAIAPTAIVTEGTREVYSEKAEKALDAAKKLQSIPSNLMPEDLIGTIAWLVSDASCFVTGQTIAVDGGTIMS
jgi:hypothetical protein